LVEHLSWQSIPTSYAGDQSLNVRAIEAIEGHLDPLLLRTISALNAATSSARKAASSC
jgi:hypothetical protein